MRLTFYLFTASIYGWIEAFAMEHGFHTGVMDLWGFKAAYHGAMLLLALTIGWGMNCLEGIIWWALVEDLAFWAASKWGPRRWGFGYKFKLTQDSWIARMLGSLKYGRLLVPVIHPALFVSGFLLVWFGPRLSLPQIATAVLAALGRL